MYFVVVRYLSARKPNRSIAKAVYWTGICMTERYSVKVNQSQRCGVVGRVAFFRFAPFYGSLFEHILAKNMAEMADRGKT